MSTHDPVDHERIFGPLLVEVISVLASLPAPFMLIGGLAVGVRASPRATRDADFSLLADESVSRRLVEEMSARGFSVRMHGTPGPGEVMRFHRPGADGIERWVDVLVAGTSFEEKAIARATEERFLGQLVPVATVEDLVVFKLVAGRPQDYADVAGLLEEHAGRLDDAYLDACAADWGIEGSLARARARLQP